MARKLVFPLLALLLVGLFSAYIGSADFAVTRAPGSATSTSSPGSASTTPSIDSGPFNAQFAPGSEYSSAQPGLPASQDPISASFPILKREALRGNVEASCRLAVGLQRCANSQRALEMASMVAPDQRGPDGRNAADQLLTLNEALARQCDGVTPDMYAEGYRFQVIAAEGGSRAQLKWLIARPVLDERYFLNNLPDWTDYKLRAAAFAKSAIAEQRAEDLQILLHMYAPPEVTALRPQFRVQDNVTFLALYEIAQQRGVSIPMSMSTAADSAKRQLTPKEQAELAAKRGQLDKGFSGRLGDGLERSFLPPDEAEFCR